MRTLALLGLLAFLPSCGLIDSYQKVRAGADKIADLSTKVQGLAAKVPALEAKMEAADLDGDGKVSGWDEWKELLLGGGVLAGLAGVNRARKKEHVEVTNEHYDEIAALKQRVARVEGPQTTA